MLGIFKINKTIMKLSIFTKFITILLVSSLIPVLTMSGLLYQNLLDKKDVFVGSVSGVGEYSVERVSETLRELGEKIIQQKAKDVAKQIEVYIKLNPHMTVKDLQSDNYFRSIAVQPVGTTGYTAVTDVKTLTARFHASDKVENLDLHSLAEKLPGFWEIMSKTEGGQPAEGYYDWEDPLYDDIKQKYMYIAVVDIKTADEVQFSVAATTYIEEFSALVAQTQKEIEKEQSIIISFIGEENKQLERRILWINIFITITVIVLVLSAGLVIFRIISRRLNNVRIIAAQIAQGNMDVKIDLSKKDEIGQLAISLDEMRKKLQKSYHDLERQVKERTKELESAKLSLEKKAKENMHELKNRGFIKSILDNSPSVIYAKDTKGRYIVINKIYEKLFKIRNEEIVDKTDFDVFPEETAQAFQANDTQVMEKNTTLELEEQVPHNDGIHTYMSIKFPLHDHNNNLIGIGGISTDITDRKNAENKLEEKVKELKRINKSMTGRELKMIELKNEIKRLKREDK